MYNFFGEYESPRKSASSESDKMIEIDILYSQLSENRFFRGEGRVVRENEKKFSQLVHI